MPTTFKISSEELERLNYERYYYPCPLVQKRLHCLYLKAITGYSDTCIGELTDAHRNSIREWLRLYRSGGYDAVVQTGYGTNRSELENHACNLTQSFKEQPPRSIAEAVLRVKDLTGIQRSPASLRAFMKRHGFRFLKTGHIPAKVNTTQQKHWVEQTLKPVIKAAQEKQLHLLFLDAAHFTLQPFLCCLWCVARIFIKASPGRNRINVLGAVNAITKEVSTYINTSYICANCIVAFLKQIKEQYPDKPIAIVLDNARYQHCFVVKTIAAGMGIHLLFLPPYSPNLNVIERLWKFTKKEILNARYYDNPQKFNKVITDFFTKDILTRSTQLQNLLTLNFQFFDHDVAHYYTA